MDKREAVTKKERTTVDDALFFQHALDLTKDGLEDIRDAAAREDWTSAKSSFARMVRGMLQPEKFFAGSPFSIGKSFLLPDETLEEAAERAVNGILVSTGTPCRFQGEVQWLHNPTENQYEEWTWQLNRHMDWQVLGEMYRRTGNETFAEAFVRYFRSWYAQAGSPGAEEEKDQKLWRTIEAGIRMKNTWPYALHSFYLSPVVTDEDLVNFFKSVWDHALLLRHHYKTANWLIMEMTGLAMIGILFPFFVDAEEWKTFAFRTLEEELSKQVYPDGFQYELSPGYHQVLLKDYYRLAKISEAYGEPVSERLIRGLERAFEVNVKLMMPDGRLPNLNDGSWAPAAPLMEPGVDLFPHRQDFRRVYTEGKEGEPPKETFIAFPYAGYFVMRSGWGRDDIWALFDAGPFGRGHQHEDKLNFLLFAYGRRLLTEGGIYAYDNSEMRKYVLSTRSHNTARVDGCDQNRRLHYRWADEEIAKKTDASWHSDNAIDWIEGVYDEGYGPNADLRVTHRRQVCFVKQPPSGLSPFFLIIDEFHPADGEEHEYQVIWHPDTETVMADGLAVHGLHEGKTTLLLMAGQDQAFSTHIVTGQTAPEWQGWAVFGDGLQGEYKPSPAVLFHHRARGSTVFPTLIYPVPPAERKPQICSFRFVAQPSGECRITLESTAGTQVEMEISLQQRC